MRLMIKSEMGNDRIVECKDVYNTIAECVMENVRMGERGVTIWFLDDFFEFNHVKPIVDKLSKMMSLSVHAEGSSLIRTHIVIKW